MNKSQIIIYTTEDGQTKIQVKVENETVWLTQAKIGELFGVDRSVVTKHLQNIYADGELNKDSTSAKIAQVQIEGKREVTRDVEFYNLDAILSVGYRVNSAQATQFRIWATERLKEYIIKGFTLDDERLKQGNQRARYFEELLQRIRDIRSNERNFYQKVTDIYATSIDYKNDSELTKTFFAAVQNKMHYAVHGHTAAEIIAKRADSNKPLMGLTSFKGEYITASDVSAEQAALKADEEFGKYKKAKDKNYISDFDREVKKILGAEKQKR